MSEQNELINTPEGFKNEGHQEGAYEAMDWETAKAVLQAVVDTPESSFAENTPLDGVGGYTTQEIRQAAQIVAGKIMDEPGAEHIIPERRARIKKVTPRGTLKLFFATDNYINLSWIRDKTEVVQSQDDPTQHYTVTSPEEVYVNQFALKEPDDGNWGDAERAMTGVTDARAGKQGHKNKSFSIRRETSLADDLSETEIQRVILGTRWMFANMLHWQDPDIITPGQLAPKQLLSSIPQPKTVEGELLHVESNQNRE